MNNELLNKNLYYSLTEKLQNLSETKKTPKAIRDELTKDIVNANLRMKDVTATIAAYYYFSLGKSELQFLNDYYHKTFLAYFNMDVIKKYYNYIITDEFLTKVIQDMYGKSILNLTKNDTASSIKEEKENLIKSLSKQEFSKFLMDLKIASMIKNAALDKKCSASLCDKLATVPRSLANKMVSNINNLNDRFTSLKSLNFNKRFAIKSSDKVNEKPNLFQKFSPNIILGKKIVAISGTKVSTFNDNFKRKLA